MIRLGIIREYRVLEIAHIVSLCGKKSCMLKILACLYFYIVSSSRGRLFLFRRQSGR